MSRRGCGSRCFPQAHGTVALGLAAAALALTTPAHALDWQGELHLGLAMDYRGWGDFDHYGVVEPAAGMDVDVGWFRFGLKGSLAMDVHRVLDDDRFGDGGRSAPQLALLLAAPVGFRLGRFQLRTGPWLFADTHGTNGVRVSLFKYGCGDARFDFRGWFLLAESSVRLPYRTSGSGVHLGFGLRHDGPHVSESTWTTYLSSPGLVGAAVRVLLPRQQRSAWVAQLNAGFDVVQGLYFDGGGAFEVGVSVGQTWGPLPRPPQRAAGAP